jgi:hypothetical protein
MVHITSKTRFRIASKTLANGCKPRGNLTVSANTQEVPYLRRKYRKITEIQLSMLGS